MDIQLLENECSEERELLRTMSDDLCVTSTRAGAVTKDTDKVCLSRLHKEKNEMWRVQWLDTKAAATQ